MHKRLVEFLLFDHPSEMQAVDGSEFRIIRGKIRHDGYFTIKINHETGIAIWHFADHPNGNWEPVDDRDLNQFRQALGIGIEQRIAQLTPNMSQKGYAVDLARAWNDLLPTVCGYEHFDLILPELLSLTAKDAAYRIAARYLGMMLKRAQEDF